MGKRGRGACPVWRVMLIVLVSGAENMLPVPVGSTIVVLFWNARFVDMQVSRGRSHCYARSKGFVPTGRGPRCICFKGQGPSLRLFQRAGTIVTFVSKGRNHRYVCFKGQEPSLRLFQRTGALVMYVLKSKDSHVCSEGQEPTLFMFQRTETVIMYAYPR